jgi:hypothetical protein
MWGAGSDQSNATDQVSLELSMPYPTLPNWIDCSGTKQASNANFDRTLTQLARVLRKTAEGWDLASSKGCH